MTGRAVMVAIAIAGCGRVGFDPLDAGAGSGSGDAAGGPDGHGVTDCWSRWRDGTLHFGAPRELTELGLAAVGAGDPSLSPDGLTLYVAGYATTQFDPYVATRAAIGDPWSAAVPVTELASTASEYRTTVTADGLTAVVSSGRTGGAGQDLWLATRSSTAVPFDPPSQALTSALNTAGDEFDPELTADGLRIYFAPEPNLNDQRIWVATRSSPTAAFDPPTEITELTVRQLDADPSLSPDQTVIVLSSTDRPNPLQMYYTVRANAGATFAPLMPVPDVAQQGARTSDGEVSANGCELYFSSDRVAPGDVFVAVVQ